MNTKRKRLAVHRAYRLKPCPFCGHDILLMMENANDKAWSVWCGECGAAIRGHPAKDYKGSRNRAKENAVMKWNRRTDNAT